MVQFSGYLTDVELLSQLSERLKNIRISKRITQDELAKMSGLTTRSISKVEAGNSFSVRTLIALMRPLDLIENFNMLVPEPDLTMKNLKALKKQNVLPQRVRKSKNK
jgi:transcriptional regulator with XRE-family HTH domain